MLLIEFQVHELSRGLVEAVREKRAGKLKRTFVSGSEAASCKINRTSIKRPGAEVEDATKRKVVNSKYGNFVAASTSEGAGEQKNLEGFVLPPKKTQQQELGPSQDFMGFCNGIINKANEDIGKKEIVNKFAATKPEKERKKRRRPPARGPRDIARTKIALRKCHALALSRAAPILQHFERFY